MTDLETREPPTLPDILYENLPMAVDRGAGWAKLRDLGPVVTGEGRYDLTRRENVLAALRDPHVFSSEQVFEAMLSPVPLIPLASAPPNHTRYRRILHPFFSPQTLGALLPSLQTQAGDIIERLAERDEWEAMAELATPYPSQVFLTLFGLPREDRQRLIDWKNAIIAISLVGEPGAADLVPAAELFQYLTDAVDSHRRDPTGDMLSQLLVGDDSLTNPEALGLAFVLVLAGLGTVTSAIGAALLELARRPKLRAEMGEHPDRIAAYVEEMHRLEPPAPSLGRITTEAVTIGAITIPAGSKVRLCVGAINRDGSDSISGDDLVMDGKLQKHWGFGGGSHRRLGAHLARMEFKLILAEWLRRIPDYELAPKFSPEITWPSPTCTLPRPPLRRPPS